MSNVTLQQLESLLDTLNQCESVIVSLKDENEALRAQVEQLREAVNGIRTSGKSTGFGSATIRQIEAERKAWQKLNEVELMTPAQCVAEIKAQAVEGARFEVIKHFVTSAVEDFCLSECRAIDLALYLNGQYAKKLSQAAKGGE